MKKINIAVVGLGNMEVILLNSFKKSKQYCKKNRKIPVIKYISARESFKKENF